MAKKHLEQYDSQGNRLDIYLNDDEVMVGDGKTLEEKLGEIDDAMEDVGDGTVKSVTINGTKHDPDGNGDVDLGNTNQGTVTGVKMNNENAITPDSNGVVDLGTVITSHQSLAALFGKVAYDGTTHRINFYGKDDVSMTTVLGYIDCSPFIVDGMLSNVEVKNVTINNVSTPCMVFSFNTDAGKQDINIPVSSIFNAANYYTKDDADGRFQLKLVSGTNIKTINNTSILGEGNISIPAGEDGKSAYELAVEDGYEGTEEQWLASLKGEKGDQGDTVVLDPQGLPQFVIVNDLVTGGGGAALSAEMGLRLKAKINEVYGKLQSVYNALGNAAFWDGKTPAATMLPDIDWGNPKFEVTLLLNLTNAIVKHNGVQVGNGDKILVEEGTTLTLTVEASSGYQLSTVQSTAGTVSQDLSTVTLEMGGSDVTLDITATSFAVHTVTVQATGCTADPSSATVVDGGTFSCELTALMGYALPDSVTYGASGTGSTASVSNGAFSISNVTSDIVVIAEATEVELPVYFEEVYNNDGTILDTGVPSWCRMTDYIPVPSGTTRTMWTYGILDTTQSDQGTNAKAACIAYNENKQPIGFMMANSATGTRQLNSAPWNGTAAYVRACFLTAQLGDTIALDAAYGIGTTTHLGIRFANSSGWSSTLAFDASTLEQYVPSNE